MEDKREKIRQQLISKSNKQGVVTYDDILNLLPEAEHDIGLLDEVMEQLMDSGVEVVPSTGIDLHFADDLHALFENDLFSSSLSPDIYIADVMPEILRLLNMRPLEI